MFNTADPTMSKFRCRFCYQFLLNNPSANYVPCLAQESEFFQKNYKIMHNKFHKHVKSAFHRTAMSEMKSKYISQLQKCNSDIHDNLLMLHQPNAATIAIICTVYAEMKYHIPLNIHKVLFLFKK